MKNLLLIIALCLSSVITKATTYYVATTGSDSNPGTITQPFRTWDKLSSVMVAGDIAYIRGGTYTTTKSASAGVHVLFQNMNGTSSNPIKIWSYPGEVPVLDLSNITPTTSYVYAMELSNCSYVHIKGRMILKNLRQIASGAGISRGFSLSGSNHCTVEQLEIFNMAGTGFIIENGSADNLVLNCDSHHNGDGLSDGGTDAWDNADAFSCTGNPSIPSNTSTRNTFDGCRGWLNSDDGWDFFGTSGVNTIKNCWAFWNGVKPWGPSNNQPVESAMTTNVYSTWHNNSSYIGSSGEGFKLGPAESQNFGLLTRMVNNCVSFENRGTGYASNSISSLTNKHQFYNNIAYKNDNDGFSYGAGWSGGATQVFKNNWSWSNNQAMSGADWVYDGNNGSISNNVWSTTYNGVNYGNLSPSVSISNADFQSVSSLGMDGARQSDGSLPVTNFLKLASTSDLVNAGVNVGLPYQSSSPDLGAFESGGTVAPNVSPTANAGSDVTVTLPANSASLNGSGTDPDGSISSYAWTKTSGPTGGTITSASSASTTVTGLVQGSYQFQLTVTDNKGATATDIVLVVVNAAPANTPPTANAGADKTITLPTNSVSLTGSGTDPGGSISAYLWTKVSGPTGGTIATATAATTNITALVQGTYVFQLKVTDNAGATATDNVQVTVNAAGNQAPTANAGADKTVTLPTSTTSLTGTGTDVGGTIASYAWTKVSGPTGGTLSAATSATTNVSALIQGVYKFELKVTDNGGAVGRDTVQVTVNAAGNQAPTANAGADKTVTLPTNTTSFTGTGTDADGTIASYAWTKVSGPTGGTLSAATSATTNVSALVQGTYKFELKVTDNAGAVGRDTVQVTVSAASPNNAYGGVRWAIPGTVEAENYDLGGQNVGYYDNTNGNNGGTYRTDYVDVTTSSEGGYLVGWITTGEWMKYSVSVASAGTYTITARVAGTQPGKSFSIEMDGTAIATVNVPATGGSQTWTTVTITNVSLTAGNKIMRIYATNAGGFNINNVKFTLAGATRFAEGDDAAIAETGTTVTTFPLPFTTSFTVRLDGETEGTYSLTLVDVSGRAVWKKEVNKSSATVNETIYMGNLPDGVYILQVVSPDQKKSSHQLIKN